MNEFETGKSMFGLTEFCICPASNCLHFLFNVPGTKFHIFQFSKTTNKSHRAGLYYENSFIYLCIRVNRTVVGLL